MAKLTKKQLATLGKVLYHAQRARNYIAGKGIAVAHRGVRSTTALDYVRASDGAILYEVDKEIGSDLCGIWDCIRDLEQFITDSQA